MDDPLVETWAIHNRINLYLLDAIPDGAPRRRPAQVPVRLRPLRPHPQRSPDVVEAGPAGLLAGLEPLDTKGVVPKEGLRSALEASGLAVAELFRRAVTSGGRVKGFKPHATAFLGYLIAHESHHRGQVGWSLKLAGHPIDKDGLRPLGVGRPLTRESAHPRAGPGRTVGFGRSAPPTMPVERRIPSPCICHERR